MVPRFVPWVAAFLSVGSGGDELLLAPAKGARLERVWREELRLGLDGIDLQIAGTPLKVTFEEVEFVEHRGFEATDEVEACAEGRLTEFVRAFDAGEMRFELEIDGATMAKAEGENACTGSRVRFRKNDGSDSYEREHVEGPLDEELLDGLAIDMDLAALLPSKGAAVGAKYAVDSERLRALFAAGGELGFAPAHITAEGLGVPTEVVLAGALGSLHELFQPANPLDGRVEAEYASLADGVARLVLTLALTLEAELDAKYSTFSMDGADPSGRKLHVEAELEGELVLLWDTDANHLRSAKFEGDLSLESALRFPFRTSPDAAPLDFEGSLELSGKAEVELAIR
jgi:hypothetical protein